MNMKTRPVMNAVVLLVCAMTAAMSHAAQAGAIKAGLYCGNGSRGGCLVYWGKILEASPDVELAYLDGEDLRAGKLDGLDILVMPGGSGFDQYESMHKEGAEAIRRFVMGGGRYFGTCAGLAFVLNEEKRAPLVPYKRIASHYMRGGGSLDVDFGEKWTKELALTNSHWNIAFHHGPVVVPAAALKDVEAETMAVCLNAIDEPGKMPAARRDSMIGTAAFVYAKCGKGELIACNCHPEARKGTRELISAAFKRLLGRGIAIPEFNNYPRGYKYKAGGKETLIKAVKELK